MSWVSLSGDGDSGNNDYKNVAKEAFSSPTTLSSRLGNRTPKEGHQRSPSGGASVSGSRRGPSQIASTEDAETFQQMFNSTAVQVPKKNGKSLGNIYDKPTSLGNGLKALGARANRYYDSRASTDASNNDSMTTDNTFSLGSVERRTRDLDLANNDNSFHVIGGLIVEFFQSKLKSSPDGKIKLSAQDIAQLDRLAPHRVRASFVEAVRHRFTNAPMDSKSSVHMLARQCHELGLDAVHPHNPLLVANEKDAEFTVPESSNYGSSQATDAAASETFEQIIAKNAANNAGGLHEKPVVETVTEDDESETYNVHSASAAITNLGTATTNKPSHHYQQQQPPTIPSAHIGRPPRQAAGGDPPAENEQNAESASGASVGTRLTKLGVEIGRGGHPLEDGYYSGASYSQQQRHENYSVQSEEAFSQTSGTQKAKLSDADLLQGASPNLSMVRTEDSSAVPTGYSTDYGNNESLAKQQLLAELREAEGLMAESKTAEAAKFWRDHVQELEARIAALDGEEGSTSSDPKKQLLEKVSSTDNSEKRMLAEIMNGPAGNYVPPSLNPFQANNAPSEGGSQGEQGSVREDAGRQTAPLGIDPSLEGVPMVDVVAPADLPGGYNFEAEIEGRRFLATVPAGGVQKGETFSCYMRDLDQVGSDIPVGRWRDGVFDCFSLGLCHPVICNALFCPLVLLGQIMTRVGFDFLGRPSLDSSINGPNTLWTILSFWGFVNVALFCAYNVKWSRGMELSMADVGALAFVNIAYAFFVVYLASATRGSLREKYYIRESRFHDLEDCCCATFCLPFSLAQMARHTADYSEYEGVCCNDTGLPDSYDVGGTGSKLQANATSSPRRQADKDIV